MAGVLVVNTAQSGLFFEKMWETAAKIAILT
jgi:hypothetical protein